MADTFAPTGPGHYRTDDGRKVRAVDRCPEWSGQWLFIDLNGRTFRVGQDGSAFCGVDRIIAPWTDPPVDPPDGWRWLGDNEPMDANDFVTYESGGVVAREEPVLGLAGQTIGSARDDGFIRCRRRIAPTLTLTIPGSTPDAVTVNGETYRRAT